MGKIKIAGGDEVGYDVFWDGKNISLEATGHPRSELRDDHADWEMVKTEALASLPGLVISTSFHVLGYDYIAGFMDQDIMAAVRDALGAGATQQQLYEMYCGEHLAKTGYLFPFDGDNMV